MHEMSVAASIVDIATAKLAEAAGKKVTMVQVAIGALSGVSADAVEFCYSACARGTSAEGSRLVIKRVDARAVCRECAVDFTPSDPLAICPSCGAFGGKIVAGEELYVDEITVE